MFAEETATKSPLLIAFHNPAGDLLIRIKISIKASVRNPLRGLSAFIIRVFDLHEPQPLWRCGLVRHAPRSFAARMSGICFRCDHPAADPKQGAGDDADHIVEEAVATDAQDDHISAPGQHPDS